MGVLTHPHLSGHLYGMDVDDALAGITDPLERLAELSELERAVRARIGKDVADARWRGKSWAQIGDVLGVSRQAAYERYGKDSAA